MARCITNLPSSTLVRWSVDIVGVFIVLKDMRLALQGQPDGLETGRDQPDYHPDLMAISVSRVAIA